MAQTDRHIHQTPHYEANGCDQCARLAEQMKQALASRATIDMAKGILMEREKVSPERAFEMLREASQTSNVKVRDIARSLVEATIAGAER